VADVCRKELLFEIDAEAAVRRRGMAFAKTWTKLPQWMILHNSVTKKEDCP
jgi:hypothetical protein